MNLYLASLEYVAPSKLKGFEEFNLESEYFTSHQGSGSDAVDFKYTDFQNYTKIPFPSLLQPMIFEAGSPMSFPASGKEHGTGESSLMFDHCIRFLSND
jgi:hypothetical protein